MHYLKEAAAPITAADSQARTDLRKYVRGVRDIERSVATSTNIAAEVVRGYCIAVRHALTDDGKPPLQLPGLVLHDRLLAVQASLDRVQKKAGQRLWSGSRRRWARAWLPPRWEPLRTAFSWIARVADVLANPAGADAATVASALRDVLAQGLPYEADRQPGAWATPVYRMTYRYGAGLFHCYADPQIPRTNNALEQYFGTARHHERRATGRKRPPAALGARGSVRVVAAVPTSATEIVAAELRPRDVARWQRLRAGLEDRHERRRAARRFRRDPAPYLAALEVCLL